MIHATAMVADDVVHDASCEVGAYVVLGMDGPAEPLRLDRGTVIRSHCVVYRGTSAGPGLHLGHGVLVREESRLGRDVSIGSHSVVEHHVRMADGVRLHSSCFVPEHSELRAGAWLVPGVIVTNARYPNEADTKDHLEGVTIDTGARIGAGAVLLPGVTIGADALVGAGAVVVDDVAPGATVTGNPARSVR